jgi:hypothetical protein
MSTQLVRLSSAAAALVLSGLLIARAPSAQTCGDADASGALSVSDGVAALRTASSLFSKCPTRLCDVDGNGTITVTDGVNILRAAAQLQATQNCPQDVPDAIDQVQTTDGTQAILEVGLAPVPEPGAPTTISSVASGGQASRGRSNAFLVDYDVRGGAAAASTDAHAAAATAAPTLIVAAHRSGEERRGAFALPLPTNAGQQAVAVTFPSTLDATPFSVDFATVSDSGEVSTYVSVEQVPTTAPLCGDFTKDPDEDCDPPGTACGTGFCNVLCRCTNEAVCGNKRREGGEECDGPDASQCNGTACRADCHCQPAVCGDGKRQGSEQCDGLDASACGSLACRSDCTCGTAQCGNNVREGDEECDGSDKVACGARACLQSCLCALE